MAAPLTAEIRRQPPQLHGGGGAYFGLAWPALAWLEEHLRPEMTTLETGSGGSSVLFAASGAQHTVISPAPDEHERIRSWCAERGISTAALTFLAEPSDRALAGTWRPEELDVVLIDGAHGFPFPTLDWFLTAPHLKVGGHVMVDDAFLPAVHSLIRFLRASDGWEQVAAPGYRTVVFRKLADGISYDWVGTRHDRWPRFDYLPPGQRLAAYARFLLIDRSRTGQLVLRRLQRR
jgi:hypothetical protein